MKEKVNAHEILFKNRRFDLIFKYLYLTQHHKYSGGTNFFEDLYCKSIEAFNGFTEEDPKKENREDFFKAMKDLVADISRNGFDEKRSVIPVSNSYELINGAHRLTVAASLNKDVTVEKEESSLNFDYKLFQRRFLDHDIADFGAQEFVKLNPNAYIINLHSINPTEHAQRRLQGKLLWI